jgi:hypothetical protein
VAQVSAFGVWGKPDKTPQSEGCATEAHHERLRRNRVLAIAVQAIAKDNPVGA